jgi:hypothetical protein
MIKMLPPLEKYKYDTWRILPVKCNIDNSMRLQSCIGNVNIVVVVRLQGRPFGGKKRGKGIIIKRWAKWEVVSVGE